MGEGDQDHQEVPDALTLARYTISQQHPSSHSWVSTATRLDALAREHDDDVQLAIDRDIAARRRDRFAPDQPVDLMLNRWMVVTPDLSAMLSIRYEGGDPALPFVDASVLSRSVTPADLTALATAADHAYGVLRPRYLRLWSCQPAGHFTGTQPDKRFLAAPLHALRANPPPPGLQLRPALDLQHYDHARLAYQAIDRKHPDHARQAQLEARDDLESSRQGGTLFDVLLDRVWSGYVAAEPGGRLGLPGFTVQELVLTEAARGRQLGRHLSTLLAHALPHTDGVLLGTIHTNNIAARDAALSAGRHDIGGWFDLPLKQR